MPQFILVLAAALAMLFNVFGVPYPDGQAVAGSPNGQSSSDAMMILDDVMHRG